MNIIYDPQKNKLNIAKHGIDFSSAQSFDWKTAVVYRDERKDYGEERRQAYSYIHKRFHSLVYTVREDSIRIISLRKANKREIDKHGKKNNG